MNRGCLSFAEKIKTQSLSISKDVLNRRIFGLYSGREKPYG